MDELMDSDDETMFAALKEEETKNATDDNEEHFMMLSCLMALYARYDAKPRRGGSTPQEQAEAEVGRLLHSLRRLLPRRPIAR
jgi:hypothetical protein